MKKTIKTKDIRVTKKIEDFLNEKVDSLEKFINTKDEKEIVIELEKETRHHEKGPIYKAGMYIHIPGKTLYAEYLSEDINLSILEAKEELQREIKKYKNRKVSLRRRKERELKKDIRLAPEARMHRKGRIRDEGL